jgi:hypothetical protein
MDILTKSKYIKVPTRYIKATTILIMVFCLNACAGKTVYLFNTGYPQDSINQVTAQLMLLGYEVEQVDAEIPPEFPDTAIATHPVFAKPDDLVSIEQILKAQNFPTPHFYQFAQGNHFYGVDNIGLYLRNGEQTKMPPVMGGKKCKVNAGDIADDADIKIASIKGAYRVFNDATLEFFRTGEVRLELEVYINGDYLEGSHRDYTGKYIAKNKTVKLMFDQFETRPLMITEAIVDTHVGKRNARRIVFTSKTGDSPLEECMFEAIYD